MEILWRGTVSEQFGEICGNCAFPQNFPTRKLGEITVFYAVQKFEPWQNLCFYKTYNTDFSIRHKMTWKNTRSSHPRKWLVICLLKLPQLLRKISWKLKCYFSFVKVCFPSVSGLCFLEISRSLSTNYCGALGDT